MGIYLGMTKPIFVFSFLLIRTPTNPTFSIAPYYASDKKKKQMRTTGTNVKEQLAIKCVML